MHFFRLFFLFVSVAMLALPVSFGADVGKKEVCGMSCCVEFAEEMVGCGCLSNAETTPVPEPVSPPPAPIKGLLPPLLRQPGETLTEARLPELWRHVVLPERESPVWKAPAVRLPVLLCSFLI